MQSIIASLFHPSTWLGESNTVSQNSIHFMNLMLNAVPPSNASTVINIQSCDIVSGGTLWNIPEGNMKGTYPFSDQYFDTLLTFTNLVYKSSYVGAWSPGNVRTWCHVSSTQGFHVPLPSSTPYWDLGHTGSEVAIPLMPQVDTILWGLWNSTWRSWQLQDLGLVRMMSTSIPWIISPGSKMGWDVMMSL